MNLNMCEKKNTTKRELIDNEYCFAMYNIQIQNYIVQAVEGA